MTRTFWPAAAFLAAFSATASAQQAVTAADFQKALKNRSVALSCADGTTGSGRYTMPTNSGAISGTYTRPGATAVSDTGAVRAQGDMLCLRFKILNGGEEKCFTVSQAGARRYQLSSSGFSACDISLL